MHTFANIRILYLQSNTQPKKIVHLHVDFKVIKKKGAFKQFNTYQLFGYRFEFMLKSNLLVESGKKVFIFGNKKARKKSKKVRERAKKLKSTKN
jgi:hypothetical protein